MKKRILSMMLAIAMVLSMLSGIALTSSAADGDKVYTLVTDASTLAAGDEIIFVAAEADNGVYNAMITYASGNNIKVAAVEVVGETATVAADSTVCPYVLGGEAGAWTFFDGANYLYTDATSANRLQAKAEVDEYATWTIDITEGVTSIVNVGNTSRGVMQYNSGNDLFACYASASQKGVNIYKLSEGTAVCTHPNATSEETVAATCTANGELAWSCPDCEATWTETTPKAAHNNEETVITPATCTTAGVKNLTCTVCGSVLENVTIPALGHNYVEGICANCGEAEPADKAFVPVTNVANLKAGDEIIFVSAAAMADGNHYAMLTYVSGNNVKSVAVVPAEDGSITATSENGIGVYTLGGEAGAWTFFDGTNYLYTNNTTANRLLAKAELDEYGYWTIEMVEGVMSINNVANTERGMLQLNYSSTSQLFSCYNKAYKAVTIYKLSDGTPVCNHANATSQETVAPTCEANGELTWTCPDCEETWTEAVPAIGHSFDEGTETTAPTCETAGVMTFTCTVCGATKTEEVAALGHSFEAGACTVCGAEQPKGKQYVLVTDASTLVAGDEIIIVAAEADNEVFYAMKAYASGNNVKGEAVTIDGVIINLPVDTTVCGYVLGGEAGAWTMFDGTNYLYTNNTTSNRLQAKAELDDYSYWAIDIAEGVTSITNVANADRGVMQYNASSDLFACYAAATMTAVTIYKLTDGNVEICTHPNATSEETVAPTCEADGELTWSCPDCEASWKEVISATGHSNDEGVVTTEPTCEATGEMTYTCTVCGSQKVTTIPALGHNYVDGTCTNCGGALPADAKYVLVTDPSTLVAGDKIIFVSAEAMTDGSYYAMLAYESGNNVKAEAVTSVDGTITLTAESAVRAYVLGGETGAWTFFDGAKYLYTSNTGSNRLQAYAELDEYGYWAIELVEGVMTVTNVANTSRGVMQYNASNTLFACYGSASQKAIAIYKLDSAAPAPECNHENATSEETVAPTCTAEGELTYTCADCGKTWTEAVPAIGHNHVGVETTAPTCDAAGVMTYTCANCGDAYTEEIAALGHNYVDGTCTNCGDTLVVAPSVDDTIKIFHTLDLASDISISFVVLQSALANYENFYLECILPEYEGNEQVGTTTVEIEPVLKGTRYYFTLTGITAVRMGDMVDAVLHMTKADGTEYISNTDTYGVSTYAYAMLNSSTDAKMLALCADLLRYGAEAQSFKGYRTDALVDAAMTEEQRAYLSDTEALTFTSTDSFLGDLENPTITWIGKTLDLGSKVGMKFVFNTANYTGEIANLSMKVTYEGSTGETKTVILTGAEAYGSSGTRYSFTFYGLLASELRTVVEVAVYEGETQLGETLRYSAESYASKTAGTNLEALTRALFAYSDSAKAFFAK